MASVDLVTNWLKPFLDENIEDYEVIVDGNNSKDSGYLSGIIYVTLKNLKNSKTSKKIELVIKKGCDLEAVRSSLAIRDFFITENFMYETVFSTFNKFQMKKGIELFNSFPKYYGHVLLKNSEVIIFENLKSKGYKLYNRLKGMDIDHCKIVLKAYAELHSLSFALRDQDNETYESLTKNFVDVFKNWLLVPSIENYMHDQLNTFLETLEIHGDQTLYNLVKEEMKDILKKALDVLNSEEKQVAFLHGDNWNNNYLFQYEENNNSPKAVAILDWQLAAIRSPLFDVGKFLFSVCSKEELDQLKELLNYYYSIMSQSLIKLGSDPEKIFSYADFKRHWKSYAWFGFVGGIMMMKLTMLDEEEAPSVEQLDEGKDYNEIFNLKLSGKQLYYQRAKDISSAYFKFKKTENFLD
ncbi:uncharacterized protein LOC130446572 [Diorhabda sublineata]|uniref:uncharacterized protein LOC130446572 n=1 Tax=Diorhabda sublineata TaxID=1163346 RepID=UPI0024E07F1E|nr:uncharacterized protein LOC130446572 [Diorhabda sublineata]XP_056638896.1 uncharacterized protein LOC130446572 [Diorhabda sublineata]